MRCVDIADASLSITLALGPLSEALGLARTEEVDAGTHSIIVPVRLTKRGVEQRLIVGDDNKTKIPVAALIKAVARAHVWVEDLRTVAAGDLSELAERAALPPAYIRSHRPLGFLVPSIIAMIIEGWQQIQ